MFILARENGFGHPDIMFDALDSRQIQGLIINFYDLPYGEYRPESPQPSVEDQFLAWPGAAAALAQIQRDADENETFET